ncbi:MAG: SgcJ/EcaC family oxidoreductase [Acidobacteriota bacterium]|nr:SgcJ/EcaC family oxidoreductase [Acidobacteriota bacterium]
MRAVLEADERWIEAFNRGDVDTIASLYTEDVVVMPPGAPGFEGRDRVREWMAELFERHVVHQRLLNDEVVVTGDWAWMRGHFTTEITPRAGGATVTEQGKHLVIWRREPDGAWRAARDIWNTDGD